MTGKLSVHQETIMKYVSCKLVFILFAAVCSLHLYAGPKEDAQKAVQTANAFLKRSEEISAGDERNKCLQNARILLEKALALYSDYIEKNPKKAGVLQPVLTRINSQIFWCNKFTTITYDPKKQKPAEELIKETPAYPEKKQDEEYKPSEPVIEEEPDTEQIEETPEKETPGTEPEKKIPQDEDQIKLFIEQLAALTKYRRLVEARQLCKRKLTDKNSGIPKNLIEQVLNELAYVDIFILSVFDKAAELKGEPIPYAETIARSRIEGVVNRFDQGILYIDMPGTGENNKKIKVEAGIPLLQMNDAFLVTNIKERNKEIMAGIASFYLLEGKTGYAESIFRKISIQKGKPRNIQPFLKRIETINSWTAAKRAHENEKALKRSLDYSFTRMISYYKIGKQDKALTYIAAIVKKSEGDLTYLLPLSNQCRTETGLYLPELAEKLVYECPACNNSRKVICPFCKGKGTIQFMGGKPVTCTSCKGQKYVECSECKKRINSPKNKELIRTLRNIFKRGEKRKSQPDNKKQDEKILKPLEEF
jgi:hypothetical protein